MPQAQFDSPYIDPEKPSSMHNAVQQAGKRVQRWRPNLIGWNPRWSTNLGNTLLEIVHALIIANLLAMSVYASLSFPLLSHAARLLDQLISKFIPLGNGTPIYRQNRNWTTQWKRDTTTLHNKDSVTPDRQSSVSLANARRTPTKYTTGLEVRTYNRNTR